MEKTEKKTKKIKTIDMIYIALGAALMAVCAWISIPIGEIPITLQTLAVCLVAGLFKTKRAVCSTLIYILLGAIGVPVFAGFKSGLGVLAGPTGGYIVGFIFTAVIVGLFSEKFNGKIWALALSMVLGIAVCYVFGSVWFFIYMQSKTAVTFSYIFGLCVAPYIVPDIVKIVVACILANRLKKFVK